MYGMVLYGMVGHGMAWHGMVWYVMYKITYIYQHILLYIVMDI